MGSVVGSAVGTIKHGLDMGLLLGTKAMEARRPPKRRRLD